MIVNRPVQVRSAQAAALHDRTDYYYKSLSQRFLLQCRLVDFVTRGGVVGRKNVHQNACLSGVLARLSAILALS